MGSLRKYLFNGAVISAVTSGVSAFRAQRAAPRDWRTALSWASWAISLTVAIGTVRIDSKAQERDPAATPKKNGHRPTRGEVHPVLPLAPETAALLGVDKASRKSVKKASKKERKRQKKAAKR